MDCMVNVRVAADELHGATVVCSLDSSTISRRPGGGDFFLRKKYEHRLRLCLLVEGVLPRRKWTPSTKGCSPSDL